MITVTLARTAGTDKGDVHYPTTRQSPLQTKNLNIYYNEYQITC